MIAFQLQRGATLIIILIITVLIMSLTAIGLELSTLEFKNALQQQNQMSDYYKTENCLHEGMKIIYAANQALTTAPNCNSRKNCANDYDTLELTTLSPSWWQTYSVQCSKNIWRYTQLLTTTTDHYTFYRITVYHFPNQFMQVTLGKAFDTKQPIIFSWQQINV